MTPYRAAEKPVIGSLRPLDFAVEFYAWARWIVVA
jgi:hypothetical protein